MKKEFTRNLLVKYLYKEATNAEKHFVEDAVATDWELHEMLDILERSYSELPKVKFSPKRSTIQSILGYSNEQTALEPC